VKRLVEEPSLAPATDALQAHFGGVPSEMHVESIDRTEGRGRAVLVRDATRPTGEPIVLAFDASGGLRWTKERPVAGILPPVGPIALGVGPSGRVSLAVCDPPTTRVALRLWDDDGTAFADFDAMDMDDCSAISVLYWPGRGWLVVATRAGATRAQLVSEVGSLAWGRGVEIGARTRSGAPASLAADSADSFVLVQYGAVSGDPAAPPHALAFRYDVRGNPLWDGPVDLGVAAASRLSERIVLARPHPGEVRATLAAARDVTVTSAGALQRQ
jgi:hypothetical protein